MKTRDSNPAPAGRDVDASVQAALAPTDETLALTAEVILLSTDGADFRRVGVDAVAGFVTLHGKVGTESEKQLAAAAVRKVDGVHAVNNLLEVAHEPLARASYHALKALVDAPGA